MRGAMAAVTALACCAAASNAPAQDTNFVRETNVAIPMRDGVVLRADVWRPSDDAKHPTLVYRTPYGKHQATAAFQTARKAVARGYAVVMQDVRGRYTSDGEFAAYSQEGRDGYDTIEWAARQPWASGAVGTFGLSYPGAVQWLAAIESPPHLKAMAPAMTFASPMQFWYSGGVWDMSWITWTYTLIAPDRRKHLGLPAGAPWDSVRERARATLPLKAMKELEGVAPWFYEWLEHPAYDPWWDWAELRGKYARTTAAVLNFSAWYDEAYSPHGAINNYAGLAAARAGQPSRSMLVMGPWSHGVPRPGRTSVGEREYGPNGWIDYDGLVLAWMDKYVKEAAAAGDTALTRAVRLFVLGSDKWIAADAWPIPGTRTDTVVFKPFADQTVLVSDASRPIVNSFADRPGAHDYRAFASNKDVVMLETAPLRNDLTVIGAMRAELVVAVDAPDADIWVKVYDVAPDGTAFNLMSPGLDVMRLSYRNAKPERELLVPGRTYRVRLGDLYTANTFKRGHKIRVVVLPSFFPDFSRNLNTGETEAVSARSRPARITVYHDDLRPFRLILPVVPASAMLSADK